MEQQLEEAGLEHEFVEAVDGRRLTAAERAQLVDEEAVARWGQGLNPALIGCVLSHRRVYAKIVERSEESALVLEDDAKLPTDLGTLADAIYTRMASDEVALLHFRSLVPCRLTLRDADSLGAYRLLHPVDLRQIVASTAYVIGNAAARGLHDSILPVRAAPDSWAHYDRIGAVGRLRCVYPRPVDVSTVFESTTRPDSRARTLQRRAPWPIPQLRVLNRRRVARKMSRVTLLAD
jgi:glycosyl transferase, family 25